MVHCQFMRWSEYAPEKLFADNVTPMGEHCLDHHTVAGPWCTTGRGIWLKGHDDDWTPVYLDAPWSVMCATPCIHTQGLTRSYGFINKPWGRLREWPLHASEEQADEMLGTFHMKIVYMSLVRTISGFLRGPSLAAWRWRPAQCFSLYQDGRGLHFRPVKDITIVYLFCQGWFPYGFYPSTCMPRQQHAPAGCHGSLQYAHPHMLVPSMCLTKEVKKGLFNLLGLTVGQVVCRPVIDVK